MELLSNIHFLRPWWFLALIPIIWIIWKIWQTNRKQGAWYEVIAPKFRHLLLGENSSSGPTANEKMGYIGLIIAWFFAVLALSGPWVKSVDIPAQKSQQGIVIVLDLSLSMLADDLPPNRISRVKYKLTDLLKQYPEYATGMVVYAGSAHTISPISGDNQTLLGLLPSLNPVMMPKFGSNPLQGLKLAQKLFDGAQITNPHIIWITDDIEKQQIEPIANWIDNHSASVTLMTVGTSKGGVVQIPNYGLLKDKKEKLILPSVPFKRFADLAKKTGIKWVELKPEDTSVKNLLPPDISSTENQAESKTPKEVNHPLDIGAYFLFILLPIVAFLFRRGTFLSLLVVGILPLGLLTPQPSYAMDYLAELPSMFKSLDQQGYQAWENKKYGAAESLFENQQWRASAMYRQGKYAQAAKLFQLDKSATGYYNLGNAQAMSGKLAEATKSYEKALQLNPNFKQAKANLAVVNNLLTQQPKPPKLPPQNDNKGQSPENQQNPKNTNQDKQDSESKKNNSPQNNDNKDQQNNKQDGQQNNQKENQQQNSSKDSQPNNGSENQDGKQNSQNQQNNNQNNADQAGNSGSKNDQQDQQNDSNKQSSGAQPDNSDNQDTSSANNSSSSTDGLGANDNNKGITEAANSDGQSGNDKEDKQAVTPTKLNDSLSPDNKKTGEGDGGKPNKKLSEKEQAQQTWLKQIPDQPGLFLKRKFEYQFQQNPPSDNDASEKQW